MKINLKNSEKINEAVTFKLARQRTVDADDINHAVEEVEERLSTLMYKKDWTGLRFVIDCNAQKFPSSYMGVPESTHVEIERIKTGWVLIAAGRYDCAPPSQKIRPLNLHLYKEQLNEFICESKNWQS